MCCLSPNLSRANSIARNAIAARPRTPTLAQAAQVAGAHPAARQKGSLGRLLILPIPQHHMWASGHNLTLPLVRHQPAPRPRAGAGPVPALRRGRAAAGGAGAEAARGCALGRVVDSQLNARGRRAHKHPARGATLARAGFELRAAAAAATTSVPTGAGSCGGLPECEEGHGGAGLSHSIGGLHSRVGEERPQAAA